MEYADTKLKTNVGLVEFSQSSYNELKEIREVKSNVNYSKDYLPQLGKVLIDYNLHKNLNVCLIHKHFKLKSGEKMVSKVKLRPFQWVITPESIIEKDLIPISWRIKKLDDTYALCPIDFVHKNKKHKKEDIIAKSILKNEKFIEELISTFLRFNVIDVFGISISLFNHIPSAPFNHVLLETNNYELRQSTIAYTSIAKLKDLDAITHWSFSNSSNSLNLTPIIQRWCDHI